MRRAALALAAVIPLAACSALPQVPPPLPDTFVPDVDPTQATSYVSDDGFTEAEHASYRVRVQLCNGYATGTAFAIDEHTLVTNRHVVEDGTEVELTSYDGRELDVVRAMVDSEADLALLTVDESLDEWLDLATDDAQLGEMVSVSGYPEGEALTTSEGPVRATVPEVFDTDPDDVLLIQVDAAPGSSGSAVVDSDSDVVGVVYAIDADEAGWAYAVTLDSLEEVLDEPALLESAIGLCSS